MARRSTRCKRSKLHKHKLSGEASQERCCTDGGGTYASCEDVLFTNSDIRLDGVARRQGYGTIHYVHIYHDGCIHSNKSNGFAVFLT